VFGLKDNTTSFAQGRQLCLLQLGPFTSGLLDHPLSVTTLYVEYFDRKKPPPPGGFLIYYVFSSRTVCKRTSLEEPGTNSSKGVLLHTVLDKGT